MYVSSPINHQKPTELPEKCRTELQAILDKIAVALGGRAAEELFVERITTGASDDLDKAGRFLGGKIRGESHGKIPTRSRKSCDVMVFFPSNVFLENKDIWI